MTKPAGKRWSIAYAVVATLFALMMFVSASGKLTRHPGAVKVIHEQVGVPLELFPVLGGLLIAGGLGLIAGIFRPRLGLAAAIGLVVYFVGAVLAHVLAGDWADLKAPIVPLLLACTTLVLRIVSLRRAADARGAALSAQPPVA